MKILGLIGLVILAGCKTMGSQRTAQDQLNSKPVNFKNVTSARAALPCVPYESGAKSLLLEFGLSDSVIEIDNARSYVKKVCFSRPITKVTVGGDHVGGGMGKAFYAVPVSTGFTSQGKTSRSAVAFKENSWTGDLEFTITATDPIDSLVIYLDTKSPDQTIGAKTSTTYTSGTLIQVPVKYYRFPEGKVTITVKD